MTSSIGSGRAAGTVFPAEKVEGVAGAFINDIYGVTAGQDLGFSRGGVISDHGADVDSRDGHRHVV